MRFVIIYYMSQKIRKHTENNILNTVCRNEQYDYCRNFYYKVNPTILTR